MAKSDVEKPNRSNVDRLFRSELGIGDVYRRPEYVAIRDKIGEMERAYHAKLEANPKYIALQKQLDDFSAKFGKQANSWKARIAAVRREFYAKGLVPSVMSKIESLVEDYNKNVGEL